MTAPTAKELLEGIRGWVEIESHTADVAGVNAVMTKAAEAYAAAGGHVERIAGRDGLGDHLSIRAPWGGAGPGILVLCHLDTVHPRGTIRDLAFRIEGDRAYGPGIYDMKGGAYLALAAFRAIAGRTAKPPLPLHLLHVADEEVGSPTSRALIEQAAEGAKYVLVTEPARDGGKIVVARKGVGRFLLKAHGRAAHSGARHQDGRSAIREVARHVLAIEAMTDYARGITFNVGQISGGTADNTVPEHCEAAIDMRIVTLSDAEAMIRHLTSLKPYDPDVRLEVTGGLNRPPYETTAAGAALFAHARRLADEIGFALEGVATGGGSDGNFTAHTCATLDGLGVDGAGAHTLEEHLLISSLEPRQRLQQRLIETLS